MLAKNITVDGYISTIDYHTAGEPFRIVVDGIPPVPGKSMLDRRQWAEANLDWVRRLLVDEPRGHAGMYGCFVTEPDDQAGEFGALFFHKDGFSTACGHGTMALAAWALAEDPTLAERGAINIDVPSGRVKAEFINSSSGRTKSIRFHNVDAYVCSEPLSLATTVGPLSGQVSFGGAHYLSVALDQTDLKVQLQDLDRLILLAKEIKSLLGAHQALEHPVDERLSGLYGVIFYQELEPVDDSLSDTPITVWQRNVTIFADGQVDRSPCGSGTSARLALLHQQDRLMPGQALFNQSIIDSGFIGAIKNYDGQKLSNWVQGEAYEVARCRFSVDPYDPLTPGFQLC